MGKVLAFTRTFDPHTAFLKAHGEAEIARAERELADARWFAVHRITPTTSGPLWDARGEAFERLQRAVFKLAETPALTKEHFRMKKRAIGPVWLKSEAEFFDPLREGIARDEERLRA